MFCLRVRRFDPQPLAHGIPRGDGCNGNAGNGHGRVGQQEQGHHATTKAQGGEVQVVQWLDPA